MAKKITARTASAVSFNANLEKSTPFSIPNGTIEKRHIDAGEIVAEHMAVETVGSAKVSVPFIVTFAVTADATGGLKIFDENAPVGLRIRDVIVECTAANASGTLKITDGTSDITNAIVCAVDKTITRAGTIDDAKSSIAEGGSLSVVANGASDRGTVTLVCERI